MALLFEDAFERGDGPPGAGWYVDSGSFNISAGTAVPTISTTVRPAIQPEGPNVVARMTLAIPATTGKAIHFRFRGNADWSDRLNVQFTLNTSTIIVTLTSVVGGASTTWGNNTQPWTYGATVTLWAGIIGGRLMAWVDQNMIAQSYVPYLQYNGRFGLYFASAGLVVNDFSEYGLDADAFSIESDNSSTAPGTFMLTIRNGGAPWTPGTPGEPTFTANNGTISEQEVLDEDTAVALYTAPTTLSFDAVYDPQNDQYYELKLSTLAIAEGGSGTGGGLTTQQALILDKLADMIDDWEASAPFTGAKFFMQAGALVVAMSSGTAGDFSPISNSLAAIMDSTNGLTALGMIVRSIWDRLDYVSDQGDLSLNTIQNNIRGSNLRDITDVYDLVAALGAPSGGDLTTIINILWEIRTTSSWTLGSVKTWIDAIPVPSNSEVLIAIDALKGIGGYNLTNIYNAIANIPTTNYTDAINNISTKVDAIAAVPAPDLSPILTALSSHDADLDTRAASILAAIAGLPTDQITSLQPILDALGLLETFVGDKVTLILELLQTLLDALAPTGAPVWPGAGKATLGASYPLSLGVTITAPMDGVIIAITGARTGQGYYTYDTVRSWRNAGALSFFDDLGHHEQAQPLNFTSSIVTPRTMRQAAGVRVRAAPLVTGTVTPWTIT